VHCPECSFISRSVLFELRIVQKNIKEMLDFFFIYDAPNVHVKASRPRVVDRLHQAYAAPSYEDRI
jgi:hypothetical protein